MNNKKILYTLLTTTLTVGFIGNNLIKAYAETAIDSSEKLKVLEINFNNNKPINIVNNKEYTPSNSNANYVPTIKGNGYEANQSKITIPFKDLGITDKDSVITVSFLMKYGGTENSAMPIGITGVCPGESGYNDLWLLSNKFGFNTGWSELLGIQSPFKEDKYYSVIAEFNAYDITKNKLYIDGVKQDLSYLTGNKSYSNSWNENSLFTIGGISLNNEYNFTDKTVIDEVKIYKKSLSSTEVKAVSKAQQIPELRTEVVDNKNVKINWATEILQENLLWNAGFEEGEVRPSLAYTKSPVTGSTLGEQSFSSNAKYSGYLGYQLLDTYGGKGNNFLFPQTQSDSSKTTWNSLKNVIDSGMNLSISVMAKSTGNSRFSIGGQGGFEKKLKTWNSRLAKDVAKGDVWLYVDKIDPSWKVQADGKTPTQQFKVFPDETDQSIIQDNHIREIDFENKKIRLANGVYRNMKAGEILKHRSWVNPFSGGGANMANDNNWTLYNFNTTVISNPYYDPMDRGFSLIMGNSTNDKLYLDDLKLGYATKVRLYRDNNKIYEGYASELNDTSATDKGKPSQVSNISSEMSVDNNLNRIINVKFNPSVDTGTSYNYNVSSVDKSGTESPLSATKKETVTSGVKGYSYVIDKNPNTNPDNTVDVNGASITQNITDTGLHYIHIKAIDNAGNVSETIHKKIDIPNLTAKSKPNENMIRLDWTLDDKTGKTFKVYQKKENSNEFQSISTTNFNDVKEVKVLNIHPNAGETITYNTWDGETVTDKKSASLKKWMEEPNNENSKGYGKGIIEVTPVSLETFNLNPSNYLNKDSNGNWNYDVIMIGTWDANNYKDISDISLPIIKSFIEDGKGILFGHDSIGYLSQIPNIRSLSTYLNLLPTGGLQYNGNQTEFGSSMIGGTSSIKIIKRGLLTNYPWNIGDIETLLTVPGTHSLGQVANGDIWMKFNGTNYPSVDNSNFYLTSWNNTAMIQTGHSNGSAKPDEQKVLANTLFYLNQLSNNNYLDDMSGQDVKVPNKPTINTAQYKNDKLEVTLNETQDKGSEYKYYVKSESKDGDTSISNIVTDTITTGLKGYSYVIDRNSNTEPDNLIDITSHTEKISYSLNTGDTSLYVHVKAIDNVGNASETLHYKIEDLVKPTLNVMGNPTTWTKDDVTLTVSATDSGSGLSYIVLPNGNKVSSQSATYVVSRNGNYVFKAYDRVGNETSISVSVTKIDKENPIINYTKEFNSNKTSGYINLAITDNLSGVSKLELPTGVIISSNSYKFPINNNGLYMFTAWDNVGNKSISTILINELNTNNNPSGISRIEYKLSGATTKDWTTYTEPFYITNEGITTITARSYDKAGNVSNEETSQVKIDKTKPINSGIEIRLK